MATDPICGMGVNERTGFKLVQDGQTVYFCSSHCLEKFRQQRPINAEQIIACHVPSSKSFFKNKNLIVTAALLGLVGLSSAVPLLVPFRETLWNYFQMIWWAILLGLVLGGVIDHFVPREYVSFILASPRKRTIFYAVILGFFMSVCSHGILALSIQLHKKGASNASVIAFLLASPWANMPLTIMLIGFFGFKAFYMIGAAIIIAVTTGLIYRILERYGLIEKNTHSLLMHEDFSIREDWQRRWRGYRLNMSTLVSDMKGIFRGALALSDMVLWWILIGMGLASLAGAYIPTEFFHQYLGPTVGGLSITLLVATVIEVCSEGSAPMAFEIFKQTGAFGNSLVFLMAGVATDYTEIGLLWHNVGRRAAIWLPIVTVPQVIFFGWIANTIF